MSAKGCASWINTAAHATSSDVSVRFNNMSSTAGCSLQLLRPSSTFMLLSDWSNFLCGFLSAIANATGPTDFPARINVTASALVATAQERFIANSNLEPLCKALADNFRTDHYSARASGFIDKDGPIIGYALAGNTELTGLE